MVWVKRPRGHFVKGSNVTTTLTRSLSGVALSSHAKLKIKGTLSKALAASTVASTGLSVRLNGTLAKTLAPLTLASASSQARIAAVSKTLAALSLSSLSKLKIKGTLSKALSSTTLSSSNYSLYDTAIGNGVDANGFTSLPLRPTVAKRYYVGSGGSDANTGLSHAQRFATLAHATTQVVAGNGDQVLVAEGTTLNEMIGQTDGQPLNWIADKGGYSALYPTVWSSYDPADPTNEAKIGMGHQRNARPVLTAVAGQAMGNGTYGYIAIKGFDFNPGNVSGAGIYFLGAASYILIENNICRYTTISFDTADYPAFPTTNKIIVRNNSAYGMWSTAGITGGLYVAGYVGPTVEDNVFYHCGWKIGANRSDAANVGGSTVFQHSFYIQTNTTGAIVRRNLTTDGGGDGGIARGDSTFYENLFIDNPAACGFGGGPQYNVDRPSGVTFECKYNAILGSDTVPGGAAGWGINTTNGTNGSRVHHNLMVRSPNMGSGNESGFSNNAAFNQPSYALYDYNLIYLWVAQSSQTNSYYAAGGAFPAQSHATYEHNNWDGVAQGSNVTNDVSGFINAYTPSALYIAEGYADKAAFMDYAINHPEAHIQRTARQRLFDGYGIV